MVSILAIFGHRCLLLPLFSYYRFMHIQKNQQEDKKKGLHHRNKHREGYDFKALTKVLPELEPYVAMNKYNVQTIDFANPVAVKLLNKSLLMHHYGLEFWEIPNGFLCPPIPGRADYIHYVADILAEINHNQIPQGGKVRVLDIGVGANCIYPIIGVCEYNWSFVGSDIDTTVIASAGLIVKSNSQLNGKVTLLLQQNSTQVLKGIVAPTDRFDFAICNPPFHASPEAAIEGTLRKLSNLKGKKIARPTLNFGGKANELWCEGGEIQFVEKMVKESQLYAENICWFSTLLSKESNIKAITALLKRTNVADFRIVEMAQGNKVSRFIAWSYLNLAARMKWAERYWQE